jgi:hypothetical protein
MGGISTVYIRRNSMVTPTGACKIRIMRPLSTPANFPGLKMSSTEELMHELDESGCKWNDECES